MAKELPYFKFEPGEWQNGNVQMLEASERLMFLEICCVYWQRLGELPYAFALHKHCNSNTSAMQNMIELNIIEVEDGLLRIKFLDQQLEEFNQVREKRSKAARSRWSDANAMQMQCKSNAIREDKKRKDNIDKEDKFSFRKSLCVYGANKTLVDDWMKVRALKKAANTETAYKIFITQVEKTGKHIDTILQTCIENSWKGFRADWVGTIADTSVKKFIFDPTTGKSIPNPQWKED